MHEHEVATDEALLGHWYAARWRVVAERYPELDQATVERVTHRWALDSIPALVQAAKERRDAEWVAVHAYDGLEAAYRAEVTQ